MSLAPSSVWLITGCSSGFGRELAGLVAARGWKVAVTARSLDKIKDLVTGDNVLPLELDVTKPDQISAAVKAVVERFGRIDVLVNNAGYGYITSIEEGEEKAIRDMFDANVFGLFELTRAVLPVMRQQRSGHIINITSVGGHIGNPASGYYAATKHAVEGWGKSLSAEVKALGIKVTQLAPGPFSTDWSGRSLITTMSTIADYDATVGARQKSPWSGRRVGDPKRAAEAMVKIAEMAEPPLHVVLGGDGYERVVKTLKSELAEIESHQGLSLSADTPA